MKISVIIPTLDEEKKISTCLDQFKTLPGDWEIIVADGGSTDLTIEKLKKYGHIKLVQERGTRAKLLNRGAELATCDVILFLHADTALPPTAYHEIIDCLLAEKVVGGAFRTWTVPENSKSKAFSYLLHLADVRSRHARLPYGDQGIFVKRDAFLSTGGFKDIPVLEDLEFSKRLRRRGKMKILKSRVQVSGRRFEAGAIRYTFYTNVFPFLSRIGVSPSRLASRYQPER